MTNSIKKFNDQEAKKIGDELGITWEAFDAHEFQQALNVELNAEIHEGEIDADAKLSTDEKLAIGKITQAHINEFQS
jgi:hypothetical protein